VIEPNIDLRGRTTPADFLPHPHSQLNVDMADNFLVPDCGVVVHDDLSIDEFGPSRTGVTCGDVVISGEERCGHWTHNSIMK
jgi:hypothetical protein